ncbi:MAG: hypothetical protein JO364_03400 [Pseudonocardiales bacterium]|nr:hypothetical protein [Pseudonocardiales bacterium]MBV9029356.1 hypothetical protein [Pseudonocardiales bacterium]
MNEHPAPHDDEAGALTPRRGPDPFTLLAGLGALGTAGTALLGGIAWLPDVDGRWVLAALALAVGLLLVVSSLRPLRR